MIYVELEVLADRKETEAPTAAIAELNESQLTLVGGGQGDIHLS